MRTHPLRFLLLAYCFANLRGQAQIGVYKRCIRVGLELAARGHEVVLFCTGRDNFHDELTAVADTTFRFIDIPYNQSEPPEVTRERFHQAFREIAPDVVVIGEAPLAGTLMEGTMTSVELGIPLVIIDNAYSRGMVRLFIDSIGSIADGLVLTGPSSNHARRVPPYVCHVAPLMEPDHQGARSLVEGLGLDPGSVVTILGYDPKVRALGLSLAPALTAAGAGMVVVSRDEEGCAEAVAALSEDTRTSVQVVSNQSEEVFFGLLGISRLAVVKYGFMQLTECLAMHTPVIAAFHDGSTWVNTLPRAARAFVHVTDGDQADPETVAAARRYLDLDERAMARLHDGRMDAKSRIADFLESLPTVPRRDAHESTSALGITRDRVTAALRSLRPTGVIDEVQARSIRLRVTKTYDLYSVVTTFRHGSEPASERLWVRRYRSENAARSDHARTGELEPERQVLHIAGRIVFETAGNETRLPDLIA